MSAKESARDLLDDPVAQGLLASTNLAHLAYTGKDGTPRVVPIWFHWDGSEIVFGTPSEAPKAKAIADGAPVALTIDSTSFPYHVLMVRGTAHVTMVQGVVPEYALAAERYFGPEQGKGWAEYINKILPYMARIAVTPESVRILDFDKRYPVALAAAMAATPA